MCLTLVRTTLGFFPTSLELPSKIIIVTKTIIAVIIMSFNNSSNNDNNNIIICKEVQG